MRYCIDFRKRPKDSGMKCKLVSAVWGSSVGGLVAPNSLNTIGRLFPNYCKRCDHVIYSTAMKWIEFLTLQLYNDIGLHINAFKILTTFHFLCLHFAVIFCVLLFSFFCRISVCGSTGSMTGQLVQWQVSLFNAGQLNHNYVNSIYL